MLVKTYNLPCPMRDEHDVEDSMSLFLTCRKGNKYLVKKEN